MKPTYNPSKKRRRRMCGFLNKSQKTLNNKIRKGRKSLVKL